jgi:hypothetical protein
VDDAVIPENGRDVQCSNCGHTWFQQSANFDPDADVLDLQEEAAPEAPVRQELDPDIANVLREEAERESAARQADAAGIETQGELGLADGEAEDARTVAARERMARMRGVDDPSGSAEAAVSADAVAGARKELLPDVDEIKSSLRPAEDHEPGGEPVSEEAQQVAAERKGGRWTFRIIVLLALLLLAIYVFSPQIVQLVPASEAILVPYVAAVNGLRETVNPIVQQGVDAVRGLIGGGGDGT